MFLFSPLLSSHFCTRKKRTEIPAFLGVCTSYLFARLLPSYSENEREVFFSLSQTVFRTFPVRTLLYPWKKKKEIHFRPAKIGVGFPPFLFSPPLDGGKNQFAPSPGSPSSQIPPLRHLRGKGERPKNWERMWADRGRKKKKKRTSLFCPPLVCTVPLRRSRSSVPKARSLLHISCLFPSLPPPLLF